MTKQQSYFSSSYRFLFLTFALDQHRTMLFLSVSSSFVCLIYSLVMQHINYSLKNHSRVWRPVVGTKSRTNFFTYSFLAHDLFIRFSSSHTCLPYTKTQPLTHSAEYWSAFFLNSSVSIVRYQIFSYKPVPTMFLATVVFSSGKQVPSRTRYSSLLFEWCRILGLAAPQSLLSTLFSGFCTLHTMLTTFCTVSCIFVDRLRDVSLYDGSASKLKCSKGAAYENYTPPKLSKYSTKSSRGWSSRLHNPDVQCGPNRFWTTRLSSSISDRTLSKAFRLPIVLRSDLLVPHLQYQYTAKLLESRHNSP